MSGVEWDGHPFTASGLSSGHSQSSGPGTRRSAAELTAGPLDNADWPVFGNLGSPAGRVRLHSADDEGTGDDDDVEWTSGSLPTEPTPSVLRAASGSVIRTGTASEAPADGPDLYAEQAPNNGSRFLAQLPPTMDRPLKFVDGRGHFCGADSLAPFLRSDAVNYLVVGVIGAHGVGKSSILNWLANGALPNGLPATGSAGKPFEGDSPDAEVANVRENGLIDEVGLMGRVEDDNNNGNNSGGAGAKAGEDYEWLKGQLTRRLFPTQTLASLIANQAQTFGLDVFVTATERMVLLDSQVSRLTADSLLRVLQFSPAFQPVTSACICPDLLPSKASASGGGPNAGGANDDNTASAHGAGTESASLRVASYLLSVCHAVLVVLEDCPADVEMLHFIHTAAMLKPSILVGSTPPACHPASPRASSRTKSESAAGEEEKEGEEEDDEDEDSDEDGNESVTERKARRKR